MTDPQSKSKVGRRLAGETAREVCELIYAPRLAREFGRGFAALTDINQAHLLMLHRAGLVAGEPAARIARALVRIEEEGPDAFELDPAREDAFFNYEAKLIALAGPDGGRLHIGRSRNDILATHDRMRARDLLLDLADALAAVQDAALAGAERHAAAVMPGYTHLQPAQPITYGFYLAGVAQSTARDARRLSQAWEDADLCPLGAGALAGTSFPVDRVHVAQLLGFPGIVGHALDAVASRDFALEILSAMMIAGVGWSRVAQDFYVWTTAEFGLLQFPDGVAGTSSIMPQKKNPVLLEHLKGKGAHLLGLLTAAAATIRGTHFTHSGDASRESMRSFWEAGDECLSALKLLALAVRSAEPDREMMRRRAAEDFSTVTDLADEIVRRSGISFREAHHVVGAVVREALSRGMGAHQIDSGMIDAAATAELGRRLDMPGDLVARCLDPERSVAMRTLPGGPAQRPLAELVANSRIWLQAARAQNAARREDCQAARDRLKNEIRALAARTPA